MTPVLEPKEFFKNETEGTARNHLAVLFLSN